MIKDNVKSILAALPSGVKLEAAAKTRTAEEIVEAINAGISIIGENYVQEAEQARGGMRDAGSKIRWHMIGHLQKNKVKKAVQIFDMIETVDSYELAAEIDRHCKTIDKKMEILIEINSGREEQKAGVLPEKTEELIDKIAGLGNVKISGLMTMGPFSSDPEDSRPYFAETKKVFDRIKRLSLPDVSMEILSMGMSASYKTAIEEGANLVRVGTAIFGERK